MRWSLWLSIPSSSSVWPRRGPTTLGPVPIAAFLDDDVTRRGAIDLAKVDVENLAADLAADQEQAGRDLAGHLALVLGPAERPGPRRFISS